MYIYIIFKFKEIYLFLLYEFEFHLMSLFDLCKVFILSKLVTYVINLCWYFISKSNVRYTRLSFVNIALESIHCSR